MTVMVCRCCEAVAEHVITDTAGRSWRFEETRMFGPVLLRADGATAVRQPGEKSKFWPAYIEWRKQFQRQPDGEHYA